MKVFLDSIGCRLNLSEIEKIAAKLRLAGHEIVGEGAEADFAIVNTCAVTVSASADSRKSIRRIAKTNCKKIFVTGCYATIAPQLIKDLPSVERVISNDRKDHIAANLIELFPSIEKKIAFREPLPGKNHRTRAFIKIQDGCDNHCTFCLTRVARGKSISQTQNEIFSDLESAMRGGAQEIVLTGVNLGSWGKDIGDGSSLPLLIWKIIDKFAPNRIRLSSLEPWDIDRSYFPIFEHPSFCRHLHLPLQAGSDAVLRKMNRKMFTNEYKNLVNNIRKLIPDIAITTDLMVGFPGETELDFQNSLTFVKKIRFAGGHVFRYSPRPGTPAARMGGVVHEKEKRSRSKKMRKVINDLENQYKQTFINKNLFVLWERAKKLDDGQYLMSGLTDNYLRVHAVVNKNLQNEITEVEMLTIEKKYFNARIVL